MADFDDDIVLKRLDKPTPTVTAPLTGEELEEFEDTMVRTSETAMMMAFELFMFFLLLWNCFEIPFRIAFLPLIAPLPIPFLFVESIIDWCFMMTFAVGFYKPFLHSAGYLVTSPKEIRAHYLRSWFIVDLVSACPWDFIDLCLRMSNPALAASQSYWLRYVICTRLVRFPRLIAQLKQWEITLNWEVSVIFFRALRIVMGLLLWLSAFSCIVNLIADIENLPVTWRVAQEYPQMAAFEGNNAFIFYLNGLYWGIITFNTVCYGDFKASTTGERAWVFFYIFLNIIFFAYITGSVVAWLQIKERRRAVVVRQLHKAKQYAKFRNLPSDFTSELLRVIRFESLSYRWEGDDSDYLNELHPTLKAEAAEHLRNTVLRFWAFARVADLAFLSAIVCRMRRVQCYKGEYLLLEHSPGSKFFVLCSGAVSVTRNNRQALVLDVPGSLFGELALFDAETLRVCTVLVKEPSEFLVLSREDFQQVCKLFPQQMERLSAYEKFLRQRKLDLVSADAPTGDVGTDFDAFAVRIKRVLA
jgi:hypothetical protein